MNKRHVYYGKNGAIHVFKLTGELRFSIGSALEEALALFKQSLEVREVIVDLREVDLLDSTILGLLSQLAIGRQRKQLKVWLVNEDIASALEQVGFDQYFAIVFNEPGKVLPAQCREFQPAKETTDSVERRVEKAHQWLMEMHPGNIKRFEGVVDKLNKH